MGANLLYSLFGLRLYKLVPFLRKSGPFLVPFLRKTGPFLVPFRDLFLEGPDLATLEKHLLDGFVYVCISLSLCLSRFL